MSVPISVKIHVIRDHVERLHDVLDWCEQTLGQHYLAEALAVSRTREIMVTETRALLEELEKLA